MLVRNKPVSHLVFFFLIKKVNHNSLNFEQLSPFLQKQQIEYTYSHEVEGKEVQGLLLKNKTQ